MGGQVGGTGRERESPMQAIIAGVLRALLQATLLPVFRAGRPIAEQRRRLAAVTKLTLPPRGISFARSSCGGVPGESVTVRGAGPNARTVLYLHGGGYCSGSPATHRAITGRLAKESDARVFAADYRLAPEHPFPAAVDDAVAAYGGLLAEGVAPDSITIAGDSAGGGLSVATAVRLRDLGLPGPGTLVLFSPWVDLTLGSLERPPRGEIMITRPWIKECARFYVAGTDAGNPLASPIQSDLRGLPPVLIQVGADELLLTDSRRLQVTLQGAGVSVVLQEFPRRWHVFQANAGLLADANRALADAAAWIRTGGAGPASGCTSPHRPP
jgi:acetyl esterase/lipase